MRESNKVRIEGYIFDIDGTLLNSSSVHIKTWQSALSQFGIEKKIEDIRPFYYTSKTVINDLAEFKLLSLKKKEKIQELKIELFLKEIDNIKPFPYVEKTLEKLYLLGIPVVLASSNPKKVIKKIMKTFKWQFVKSFISMDDVTHNKPHPEMILNACEILKEDPAKVAMIGDSIDDFLAAKRAEVKFIAITSKYGPLTWTKYHPHLIISNFRELYQKLPLFL